MECPKSFLFHDVNEFVHHPDVEFEALQSLCLDLAAKSGLRAIRKDFAEKRLQDMDFDEFFPELGRRVGELVAKKQAAYGNSFGQSGEIMRVLYPNGVPLEKMEDMLTVVRVLDKLFRIATDRDAMGESPWKDICGYALLALSKAEDSDE